MSMFTDVKEDVIRINYNSNNADPAKFFKETVNTTMYLLANKQMTVPLSGEYDLNQLHKAVYDKVGAGIKQFVPPMAFSQNGFNQDIFQQLKASPNLITDTAEKGVVEIVLGKTKGYTQSDTKNNEVVGETYKVLVALQALAKTCGFSVSSMTYPVLKSKKLALLPTHYLSRDRSKVYMFLPMELYDIAAKICPSCVPSLTFEEITKDKYVPPIVDTPADSPWV